MDKKVFMEDLFDDYAVVLGTGDWIMDSVVLLARTCVQCNQHHSSDYDIWLGLYGRAEGQCSLLNRLFPELRLCLNTDCAGLFVSIDIAGYEFSLDEVANYYE